LTFSETSLKIDIEVHLDKTDKKVMVDIERQISNVEYLISNVESSIEDCRARNIKVLDFRLA